MNPCIATNTPIDTVSESKDGDMHGVKTFVKQHRSRWRIKIGYGYAGRVSPNLKNPRIRDLEVQVNALTRTNAEGSFMEW